MSPSNRLSQAVRFGGFVADPRSGELYRDGAQIKLQEQPFKILTILLGRAGEVVTREELREELWPGDTFVDFDHSINVAIAKLREALGDPSEEPQFVKTVGRRGYRFTKVIEPALEAPSPRAFRAIPILRPAQRHSVGREKERVALALAFESAATGSGLLVCVAGEPGIGKTTLVQDFLCSLQADGKSFDLAIGRCSQRLAGEEAYLPFLEALDSLLRGDGQLAGTLRDLAPSWYAQLFPLLALQAHARATTQEKVKRELATFLCEITSQNPLVLFFDDVHWTDPSTIDLLAHLGTKFDGTRILVIVTYRPTELLLLKHPFIGVKRDLQGRALCREIEVEFLSPADVERYIGLEFLGNCFPREFAGLIHSTTEGNPLFMVDLLRYLRDCKVIVKKNGDASWHLAQSLPDLSRNIPQSVNGVIERKIDQLSDRDREVLTAAAVQGYEFDSAALAPVLEGASVEIEETLDRLERVHAFAKRVGEDELSGSTPTVRYRFVHVLYQNALYARLTPTRRVALSMALAHGLESLYGDRSSTIASQLAFLYETARNPDRAADYFLLAAQNAQRIFANQEAIALARHGLALLNKIPESPERTRKELDLQLTLAFSFLCTQGYASPETGANMARARELCEALGDTASLLLVIFGLWTYYLCKGDMKFARETAEHLLSISHNVNDSASLLVAHATLAITLELQGELIAAREQFEETSRHYDFKQQGRYVQLYRLDPGIQAESDLVRVLWLLGFPDQARQKIEETLTRARAVAIPVTLAFSQRSAAWHYQNLRQPEKAREIGEACIALCDEHGILLERAWVECPYGWAVAELGKTEEGISHIRAGLEAQLSIGAEGARPQMQAISAETLWHAGRTEEALQAVEDGLAASSRNGDNFYDAELWRLKGELLKMQDKSAEAESCFQKAVEIAREQAAKSLELRACTSLVRLWQKQGRQTEARSLLGEIYGWFTEGFDTADLREAAALLEELA
ncbi:MAG: AAA family ATPase [Acidobacteriia bacterium]|nr:AAA family ATPase [Terriglobia bacterium]